MSDYVRLCTDLADKGTLIEVKNGDLSEIYNRISLEKDSYISAYYFSDKHNKHFKEKGSVAGITDVFGTKLFWDFDSANNLNQALIDLRELVKRAKKLKFKDTAIKIFFSGQKGFEMSIELKDKKLSPAQIKNICMSMAESLQTVDPVIYNPTRIIRLPLTKHQKTGLYKIPLSVEDVNAMEVPEILDMAKNTYKYEDIKDVWESAELPESLEATKNKAPELHLAVENVKTGDMDISNLDRNIPEGFDIVRWAILKGYFENGERSTALVHLAAYLKNKKFDIEHTYRMLKGTCELQSKRTGDKRFPDSELYNNIIGQVYGDNWKGGIGSLTDPGSWLYTYAKKTGLFEELSSSVKQDVLTVQDSFSLFTSFAANIDNNRLQFGIKELDENLDALVGRTYILGGSPGCGKTSLALQILNNTSLNGTRSIFFSFDMSLEDVMQKLVQKHFKINAKEVYAQSKDKARLKEFAETLYANYKNVHFIRSSGMTVEAMRNRISQIEKTFGEVRMVVVDYLDLVQADFSDPTQKSMAVMQGLKSIGTDMRKCVLVAAQPNKANQKINEPVSTYAAIKGSSALGELANAVLWVHRPGASARGFERDKFYSIDCLKNRHGAMFNLDFAWEGISGTISSLTPTQKVLLSNLRDQLKEEASSNEDSF